MVIIHNVLLFYTIFYFFLIQEFHNYQEDIILLKNRYQELQRDSNSSFSQYHIRKERKFGFYLFDTLFLMYFVDCFYCHICIFIKIFITPLCLLYPSRVTIVLQTEKWSTVIVLNDTVYLNGCMSLWEYKILGRGIVAQKVKYIHNFERIIKISMVQFKFFEVKNTKILISLS